MAPAFEKAHGGIDTDAALTEYVASVGRPLIAFSQRSDFPHTFFVLASEQIINAFALGNGNVYVTRALLNILDDEAELAEILGHEIGHVAFRHIGARIDQMIGTSLLLAVAESIYRQHKGEKLKEKDDKRIEAANKVLPALILNGFSRDQELESDKFGLRAMVGAGYDPFAAVRVFERFQKREGEVKGLEVFFRSHPTAKVRISDLSAQIRQEFPGARGKTNRDQYQQAVKEAKPPSADEGVLGLSTPVATAAGVALITGVGILIWQVTT